jgi:hypothetical protein
MTRDPFDGMSGDELDPQAAESDQLAALGMHEVGDDDEKAADAEDEEEVVVAPAVDPSDDLDRDGLAELEQMEKQILEEDPVLDFATALEDE